MNTITKKEIIHKISMKVGIHPNEVKMIIKGFLDGVMESLVEGNRLEFREFGVFDVVKRKQKIGRNPKKASIDIVIPEKTVARFKAGRKMEKLVKESERK
jgi:nucleoid DNA-binding protein